MLGIPAINYYFNCAQVNRFGPRSDPDFCLRSTKTQAAILPFYKPEILAGVRKPDFHRQVMTGPCRGQGRAGLQGANLDVYCGQTLLDSCPGERGLERRKDMLPRTYLNETTVVLCHRAPKLVQTSRVVDMFEYACVTESLVRPYCLLPLERGLAHIQLGRSTPCVRIEPALFVQADEIQYAKWIIPIIRLIRSAHLYHKGLFTVLSTSTFCPSRK